jgi:hypothetical protein
MRQASIPTKYTSYILTRKKERAIDTREGAAESSSKPSNSLGVFLVGVGGLLNDLDRPNIGSGSYPRQE